MPRPRLTILADVEPLEIKTSGNNAAWVRATLLLMQAAERRRQRLAGNSTAAAIGEHAAKLTIGEIDDA